MPRDSRLYMTFPNDIHRNPKITRLPVEVRWTFLEVVAERAIADTEIIENQWLDGHIEWLEAARLIRREGDGIRLIQNDLWAVVRPYRAAIPPEVRAAIYERDDHRCRFCGATEPLQIDHIFPWSLGGTDEPSNLQTLCAPCNQSKGAKV